MEKNAPFALTIHGGEVASEVARVLHLAGMRLRTADTLEQAARLMDVERPASYALLARALQNGLETVRARCARYLVRGSRSASNALAAPEADVVLELAMPRTWNYGMAGRLASLVQAYLAENCLQALMVAELPAEAATHAALAAEALAEVKRTLELRTRPVERPFKLY